MSEWPSQSKLWNFCDDQLFGRVHIYLCLLLKGKVYSFVVCYRQGRAQNRPHHQHSSSSRFHYGRRRCLTHFYRVVYVRPYQHTNSQVIVSVVLMLTSGTSYIASRAKLLRWFARLERQSIFYVEYIYRMPSFRSFSSLLWSICSMWATKYVLWRGAMSFYMCIMQRTLL